MSLSPAQSRILHTQDMTSLRALTHPTKATHAHGDLLTATGATVMCDVGAGGTTCASLRQTSRVQHVQNKETVPLKDKDIAIGDNACDSAVNCAPVTMYVNSVHAPSDVFTFHTGMDLETLQAILHNDAKSPQVPSFFETGVEIRKELCKFLSQSDSYDQQSLEHATVCAVNENKVIYTAILPERGLGQSRQKRCIMMFAVAAAVELHNPIWCFARENESQEKHEVDMIYIQPVESSILTLCLFVNTWHEVVSQVSFECLRDPQCGTQTEQINFYGCLGFHACEQHKASAPLLSLVLSATVVRRKIAELQCRQFHAVCIVCNKTFSISDAAAESSISMDDKGWRVAKFVTPAPRSIMCEALQCAEQPAIQPPTSSRCFMHINGTSGTTGRCCRCAKLPLQTMGRHSSIDGPQLQPVDPAEEAKVTTVEQVPTVEPAVVPTEEPVAIATEEQVSTEEPAAVATEKSAAVATEEQVSTEKPAAVATEKPAAVATEEQVSTEEPAAVATEEQISTEEQVSTEESAAVATEKSAVVATEGQVPTEESAVVPTEEQVATGHSNEKALQRL